MKIQNITAAAMVIGLGVLSGCTTAGPFVTNVSSDGKGNLIVEKNTVKLNPFIGIVSSGDHASTETVRIVPGPAAQAQ